MAQEVRRPGLWAAVEGENGPPHLSAPLTAVSSPLQLPWQFLLVGHCCVLSSSSASPAFLDCICDESLRIPCLQSSFSKSPCTDFMEDPHGQNCRKNFRRQSGRYRAVWQIQQAPWPEGNRSHTLNRSVDVIKELITENLCNSKAMVDFGSGIYLAKYRHSHFIHLYVS